MTDLACLAQNRGQRRVFWATQAETCGHYIQCGHSCALPGLAYVSPGPWASIGAPARTIQTEGWLNGLILNIVNTRARTDLPCSSPVAIYGHWSESYRKDGLYVGSRLWNAAEKAYTRVSDSVKAVQAAIQADMAKLIIMGVAESAEVTATYHNQSHIDVLITVVQQRSSHSLNLAGTFTTGTWVWR